MRCFNTVNAFRCTGRGQLGPDGLQHLSDLTSLMLSDEHKVIYAFNT